MLGHLAKMKTSLSAQGEAQYQLVLDDDRIDLNARIGQAITLKYEGQIHCHHCGKKTKKSYSQGYCFICMKKLAACDMCIMKPETCHYDNGTCREPSWGEQNCMIDHYVYLANTSGLKVGITRHTQIPTRWIDQGASQALPILRVKTRLQSGLVEQALANHVADKTNWRALLKGEPEPIDLQEQAEQLLAKIQPELDSLQLKYGEQAIERLDNAPVSIRYPVLKYPTKLSSHNFDKQDDVSGILLGIKGQYLILDTGVINIRKFTSYQVELGA